MNDLINVYVPPVPVSMMNAALGVHPMKPIRLYSPPEYELATWGRISADRVAVEEKIPYEIEVPVYLGIILQINGNYFFNTEKHGIKIDTAIPALLPSTYAPFDRGTVARATHYYSVKREALLLFATCVVTEKALWKVFRASDTATVYGWFCDKAYEKFTHRDKEAILAEHSVFPLKESTDAIF